MSISNDTNDLTMKFISQIYSRLKLKYHKSDMLIKKKKLLPENLFIVYTDFILHDHIIENKVTLGISNKIFMQK